MLPRQRKRIVIIISDGKRHDKIHELKGYTIESCPLGGCLDRKISETLTKHLCIMINAKKYKTRANKADDVKTKDDGTSLKLITEYKCFSKGRLIRALDIISTISTLLLLMNSKL